MKHAITDNIVPEKVIKTRLKASNIELSDQEFEIVICQLRKERLVSVHVLESEEKVLVFEIYINHFMRQQYIYNRLHLILCMYVIKHSLSEKENSVEKKFKWYLKVTTFVYIGV